jgi:hypothetical protein
VTAEVAPQTQATAAAIATIAALEDVLGTPFPAAA